MDEPPSELAAILADRDRLRQANEVALQKVAAEVSELREDNARLERLSTSLVVQIYQLVKVLGIHGLLDPLPMRTFSQMRVYLAVMARLEELMKSDPSPDSPDGLELNQLADLTEFYERHVTFGEPNSTA